MLDFSFADGIREWLERHRQNLYLLAGVLLVGALAFESGFLRGKLVQSEPLLISIPAVAESSNNEKTTITSGEQPASVKPETSSITPKPETGQCLFVGSRNSNKYHLNTCAVVKRIKPENKICFASKEDAEKRGYVPSCLK